MKLSLDSIHIPPEEDARIREPENLKQAVKGKSESILRFGQMQPILVEELDEPLNGKKYKLVDGQVRWVSLQALNARLGMGEDTIKEAFERWDIEPGKIEVTTRPQMDPIMAKMMEFHANEDRDNFTWEEKGRYIRTIHDMLRKKHGIKWTARLSAEYIGQHESTVSQYLKLTDERDPVVKSPRVQKAKTKGAALKQYNIEKDRERRRREAASKTPTTAEESEAARAAELSVYHGDCREWIKQIPDESLSWFHWDPPYGGGEGRGGAFAGHAGIEDDHSYAMKLMLDMFDEIHRVLKDGSWIALWYTPVHYNWIRLALQGHRFDSKEGHCLFCGKHILRDHEWLSSNYTCRPSAVRFWVNPYPNYWYKSNRMADGHEIQRFLLKQTEPFLFAGKNVGRTPILVRSDRSNVFDFETFPQHSSDRRHVHHKPAALLEEILTCISVQGSLGADAGAGSGSILEATYGSGRRALVAELREEHHADCLDVAGRLLKEKKYSPTGVAAWLEKQFDPEFDAERDQP